MPAPTEIAPRADYPAQLLAVAARALAQLVRAPSHSRRAEAARKTGAAFALAQRCRRGPGHRAHARLRSDRDRVDAGARHARACGRSGSSPISARTSMCSLVLAAALVIVALVAAGLHGTRRAVLLGLGTRLQFLFLSVAVAVFAAEILKFVIGRGRPFVGGKANPFNFVPFQGTEAYFSLPSAHAVTAFALAFAVSALWPRLRVFMFTYAIVILLTRLVLLAHHPSDVMAGALVGHRRRHGGPLLVCGSPARLCDPRRRHHCAASRSGRRPSQKGCPRAIRPIKAAACRGRRFLRWRANSNHELRFVDVPAFGFHRRSRAQRSRQHRAADRRDQRGARWPLGL